MKKILLLSAVACFIFPLSAKNNYADCPVLDTIMFAYKSIDTAGTVRERMLPFIDYLRGKDKPCSTMVTEVEKRFDFFYDTATFKINTENVQWIGDTGAPVTIVIYVSMMCPHCKQLYAQLYDTMLVRKKLSKQVRIGLKNLSVTEYDQMFAVAAQLGKQPRFMRTFARISERASDESMKRVADSIGIAFDSLKKLAGQVSVARIVNSSREEALRNKVTSTPAIFINSHRYNSSKDIHWILEAAAGSDKSK